MTLDTIKDITIPEGEVKKLEAAGVTLWEAGGDFPDYLCFTAEEAGSTVKMRNGSSKSPEVSLEYSTDRNTWYPFVVGSTIVTLNSVGDTCYLRGDNSRFATSTIAGAYDSSIFFSFTGKVAASGNLMSIFDKTVESTEFTEENACVRMFNGCTQLTSAPKLPATTLTKDCYYRMFGGCTGLTESPVLPATEIKKNSYYQMFYGCTSLQSVKVSFASFVVGGSATGATSAWLTNVAENGVFYCPSALNISSRSASTVPDTWTIVRTD